MIDMPIEPCATADEPLGVELPVRLHLGLPIGLAGFDHTRFGNRPMVMPIAMIVREMAVGLQWPESQQIFFPAMSSVVTSRPPDVGNPCGDAPVAQAVEQARARVKSAFLRIPPDDVVAMLRRCERGPSRLCAPIASILRIVVLAGRTSTVPCQSLNAARSAERLRASGTGAQGHGHQVAAVTNVASSFP
jgi:hypothetical protein